MSTLIFCSHNAVVSMALLDKYSMYNTVPIKHDLLEYNSTTETIYFLLKKITTHT